MNITQYRKKPAGKDFLSIQIAQRYYRLEYNAKANKSVLMTGSDVTTQFSLDFTFMIDRIELTHRDTNNDLSVTELEVTVERKAGSVLDIPLAETPYFVKKQLNSSRMMIDLQKDKRVFEAGTHSITIKGTSTDIVTPVIYIVEIA